ncbi:phosphotransferase [Aeromicrobium sp.]|uniref:phosphotransferase n=1 Tax=Aeromicrobium sp. TaxID=1871063 RepID=UPI003D6B7FFA
MSLSMDAATASRLAELDSSLAALPRALAACSPNGTWPLHDVRWTPGQGCRLAFLDNRSFFAAHVDGDHWTRFDWLDDPKLPSLATAADPVEVGRRLEPVLGGPVRVSIAPVRYRPGSRGVLRYDVTGPTGTSTLFAKALQPESYRRVEGLHAGLDARADQPAPVAEMVAWWPDLQVVVGRSVDGRSASSVLGDGDVPADDRAQLGRELGELLARFHALEPTSSSTWSAGQQVTALADALGAVQHADAAMGARLGAVIDTLAATMPATGRHVLGHGSFRAGQVVVTPDGRPVLLDIDGVAGSEPERDLGGVLAHLTWQGVRQPHHLPTLDAAERELLEAYQESAGSIRPDALRWWQAAGIVQVAVRRYRRLEVRSWPLIGALADAAEALVPVPTAPNKGVDLLDVRPVSVLLGHAMARDVEVESAEPVAAAPGRRSVIRYAVRGLDNGTPQSVIGKQFAQARPARLSYLHLQLLSDGPFGDGPFRVPSPIGLASEHRLLFYREDQGKRLDSSLNAAGVRRAAGWLARLHMSELRLPREFSQEREVESTGQWAELIALVHPPAAAAATDLASRWAEAAQAGRHTGTVPIHKDFHAGHVLLGDDHTCVIDLDEARMGDPTFDVAHFCTYLFELGAVHYLTKVFLDEYAAATGWTDRGSYAAYCAYTSLKIAKQAAAGSGPYRGLSIARRMEAVDAALTRGAAWLTPSGLAASGLVAVGQGSA